MEKVKHQHYVPRMYLKRFGYGNDDDKKITVLKLDTGIILENQRTENFAAANFYYDASKEEIEEILEDDFVLKPELRNSEELLDEQYVEHALSRQEADVSKMLNELQEDLDKIYVSSNISLMIIFLHTLAYRTKEFRDSIDDINNKTVEFLSSLCDKMGYDEKTKKETIEANCNAGKKNQLYQIMALKPVLHTMHFLVENYDWYPAVNNTELDFVISDNPAHGIRYGFNDICIPISRNKAIIFRIKDKEAPIISKDMPVNNVIDLSLKSVIAYNVLQLGTGQRFLFGTSKAINFMKNFWELDKVLKKRESL